MEKFQWIIAAELAEQYHRDQKYGEHSYIKHLIDVDRLLVCEEMPVKDQCEQYVKVPGGYNDILRATAWLHDILEDTECKVSDLLAAGISRQVVSAVVLLTKTPGYNLKDYLEAICTNPVARTVKKWDSFANMVQNLRENNSQRAFKYAHQMRVLDVGTWSEAIELETTYDRL